MENNNRKKSYSKPIGNDCPAGLVPPHDVKLEQAVLGAMLLESDLYAELAGILTADTFYDPRHAALFAAIRSVATAGRPVDLFTVSSALRETKSLDAAGGIAYVTECSTRVGSGAHALYHAQILRQLFIMRTMIAELNALSGKCYDGDFDGMMSEYAATTGRIDSLFAGSGAEKHIRDIVKRHGQVVDDRIVRANQGGIQGITYGLSRLDRVTNGARPDQLIIVAARPAMGKTALALKFAKSAAKDNRHVTIASLEMSDISLTDRLVSTYAGVDSQRLKSGRMDARDLKAYQQAVRDLERLEISIYDTPNTTFGRLAAMARTKHRKGRLDLLIIDYLQLIETDTDGRSYRNSREREVADISRGLKSLAIELKIPIILLCQLNRAAENRNDRQPKLHDLRESGGIEQDADLVLMPFRPAYYKEPGVEVYDDKGQPMPDDLGLLYIRKHRDGATGQVPFRYTPDLSTIEDYETIPANDEPKGLFKL